MRYVLLLALVVELGGSFGAASVEGEGVLSGEIEVTISVTVGGDPVSVVAHFVDPGDDQLTVTLGARGDGTHGATAIVERADLIVVFEAIGADGFSEQSRPVSLTDLGLDPTILLDAPGVPADESEAGLTLNAATQRWGWAALGLGAAALSLLAWWALADYPKRRRVGTEEPVDQG